MSQMIERIGRRIRAVLMGRLYQHVRNRDLAAVFGVLQQKGIAGCAVIIGSNSGQEMPLFTRFFREIHLVDPLIPQLQMHAACAREGVHLHPVALSCTPGTRSFFMASNNGESSSLRRPTHHLAEYPEISFSPTQVAAERLADMEFFPRASVLMLDVQGNEMDVLRSAWPVRLRHVSVIICEYSLVPLYEGSGVLTDLNALLEGEGFTLAFTTSPHFTGTECTGDAIFVRTDLFANAAQGRPEAAPGSRAQREHAT